jgi:hypothetical protein
MTVLGNVLLLYRLIYASYVFLSFTSILEYTVCVSSYPLLRVYAERNRDLASWIATAQLQHKNANLNLHLMERETGLIRHRELVKASHAPKNVSVCTEKVVVGLRVPAHCHAFGHPRLYGEALD